MTIAAAIALLEKLLGGTDLSKTATQLIALIQTALANHRDITADEIATLQFDDDLARQAFDAAIAAAQAKP